LSRTVLNSRHASRGQRGHLAMQPTFGLADNHTATRTALQIQEQQPSAARSSGQQTAKGNSQDVQQGGSCRSRRHKSYGAAT
ncbi:hypothetical protein QJQ45_014523, partial [Haematococcus lacustris]